MPRSSASGRVEEARFETTVRDLDGGTGILKLTVASYYRPSGENIHHFTECQRHRRQVGRLSRAPGMEVKAHAPRDFVSWFIRPAFGAATERLLPRATARPMSRRPLTTRKRRKPPIPSPQEKERQPRRLRKERPSRNPKSGTASIRVQFADKQLGRRRRSRFASDWPS